jgi:hypothetical protein
MREFDRYYVRYESEYLEHDVEGKFMLVEDHLSIVEKLKAEIKDLEGHLVDAMYRIGF